MYRTKCTMYDEVSVGNPGKVPYCAKQDKLEPDCQHCKQQYVTNADKIRQMDDEELASIIDCPYHIYFIEDCKNLTCWQCKLEWLKEEVKDGST